MKLFVYGTLKKGNRNHHWLNGAEFIEEYTLENMGLWTPFHRAFPYMHPAKGKSVVGEVYEVSQEAIHLIDRHEGPNYERREVAPGISAYVARAHVIRGSIRYPRSSWIQPS